ncbi:MAG: glycerophosphodiester phosphodiesterase [Clostridia bacterium]|nr:glycerophosphodiester phosphodiesterase [Clostridia bacterium]
MMVLYIILAVIGALVFLYFFAICPANGRKVAEFDGKLIAHRGLHGGDIKENTRKAFEKAVELGYGIELDIQLSSDKVAVINHDYTLKRVFGVDKKVSELTARELRLIGVPTLKEVLDIIGGKVPLVAEIKGENANVEVCEKAAELLDNYDGIYCVESFNPLHLRWFKKHRPKVIRGQLSTAFGKRDDKKGLISKLLRYLLLNFLSRPHFIAYEHNYKNLSLRLCSLLGAHMVCWTIKSASDLNNSKKRYKTFIFEEFEP